MDGSSRLPTHSALRAEISPAAESAFPSETDMQFQMAQFVDYVLTSGTNKVTAVKQIKAGHDERFSDFYRPVREAIVDMHQKGEGPEALDEFVTGLRNDPREARIFPKVVRGYGKFLRSAAKMTWFEPPMRDYPLGPIGVRVNPEIGLLINGQPHAIKLYFRSDPISQQRIIVTNQLLANALSTTWPGTVFAVLDVRRGRLFPYYGGGAQVGLLLKAEAASLASLWWSEL
jgi:hypothetical protein